MEYFWIGFLVSLGVLGALLSVALGIVLIFLIFIWIAAISG